MCAPGERWPRRAFLTRSAASLGAAAVLPAFRLPTWRELRDVERPHLEVALKAWAWLETARVETEHGITWPADPLDPDSVGPTLYTHSPGVVPFVLELFHSTQDERYLTAAKRAADHLAAVFDESGVGGLGAGLYVGVSGLAFVFEEVHRASNDPRYRDLASRAVDAVIAGATPAGNGVAWPQGQDPGQEVTDIVSGAAGTGLALLWLDERGHTGALDTAVAAGRRLLDLAEPASGGSRWQLSPGFQREYPNFSHGTGGVAYFLATLAERTGDPAFYDAAVEGARYLQVIANTDNGGYRILHYTPEGEDRYYLSWCHGPVGTNRLFYRLWSISGEAHWLDWVHSGARGVMNSGVPEQRTPGFWENISQCGGEAGLGEFFLAFHRVTGEPTYAAFVERINASLLGRSTEEAGGMKWTQSEHRVQPDLLVAQTGFMQGAAGVGKYFLHADAMAERDEGPAITLPDAPY